MPRVREVFARAYGAVPEGATCHVGWASKGVLLSPTYKVRGTGSVWAAVKPIWDEFARAIPIGGDISDQPAAAFSPVFQCAAYDAALDALRKEDVDPRNVIALADAWAVAEDEAKEESDYPRVILQRRVNAELAKSRFRTASREFWASLSADGTGESPVLSTHLDVMGEGK